MQIDDASISAIGCECIDGEVPSLEIFFETGNERNRAWVPAVDIVGFTAERRHLEALLFKMHGNRAMLDAGRYHVLEELHHLVGESVGGEIIVFAFQAQKMVAHSPSHDIEGESCIGEVPGKPADDRRNRQDIHMRTVARMPKNVNGKNNSQRLSFPADMNRMASCDCIDARSKYVSSSKHQSGFSPDGRECFVVLAGRGYFQEID